MSSCKLKEHKLGLVVDTPFDRDFVYELKNSIPSHERVWNDKTKTPRNVWIVHPKWGKTVQGLCQRHFGDTPEIPDIEVDKTIMRGTIKILYVGACKEREDGTRTSFGMHFDSKKWSVVFPESVLKNWFEGDPLDEDDTSEVPNVPKGSYYMVLGLKNLTDDDAVIKKAFRRMSMQWHPDTCKEPDANERFLAIKEAYDILSDNGKRKMYNLGLKMQERYPTGASRSKVETSSWYLSDDYRPPLRCGILKCKYQVVLGRAFVKEILSWDDITNNYGETLVTSWIWGCEEPIEMWV